MEFTEAFRTTADQEKIYADPNSITPAKPGRSLHEAGRAVDIKTFIYIKSTLGKVVENAVACGIKWGGSFGDDVHFYQEVPGGPSNRSKYIKNAQNFMRRRRWE